MIRSNPVGTFGNSSGHMPSPKKKTTLTKPRTIFGRLYGFGKNVSSIRSNFMSDDSDTEPDVTPGPAEYASQLIIPVFPKAEEY